MKTQNTLSTAAALTGLESLIAQLDGPSDTSEKQAPVEQTSDTNVIVADAAPQVEQTAAPADKKADKAAAKAERERIAAEKKSAKIAAASAAKKAKDDKKVADAAAKAATVEQTTPETKPEPVQKIFFGRNKLGRLEHKLGPNMGTAMLLTFKEADLEGDASTDAIAANKTAFKTLAVKVQNRATNVIEFVSGKSARLNPVIEIAIRLLAKERKLVTGDNGNLFTRLSALYTPGAARSMGNSTMGMLKALKIVEETSKQNYTPNPQSTLLALISSKLSLSFIDQDAALARAMKVEAEEDAARGVQSSDDTVATVETAPVKAEKVDEPVSTAPADPMQQIADSDLALV